jgi:hypothetical protein
MTSSARTRTTCGIAEYEEELTALVEHAYSTCSACRRSVLGIVSVSALAVFVLDNEVELRGLFHGQICGLFSLQ